MQVKLELESARVKGVTFHPSRPWVLYCTHAGTIHLYDYDIRVELSRYSSTGEKPVRCVDFHPTQPLFACGTDNGDVVVYNWQRKMKLFSLTGHIDFVRSVEFHNVYPLLVSASDDCTVRIWNWQNRVCVAILDEHTQYVMCARFNFAQPLVATACMDDCVRVFDISVLLHQGKMSDVDSSLFSTYENASLVSELEEHVEGANAVAWDQTGNKLVSGGADMTVKLFNMHGSEAVLSRTLTPHSASVTGVAFHMPTGKFVSASEDGKVVLFDAATYTPKAKHEIPGTRFWCCACHPKEALIAAGHDRGLVIGRFAKERPAFDVQGNSVLWVQDSELHIVDVMSKDSEKPVATHPNVKSVSWNSARSSALVSYTMENGDDVYDIVDMKMKSPIVKGNGGHALWISRSSIVALSTGKDKLFVSEVGGSSVRSINLSNVTTSRCLRIFPATQQRIFIVTRGALILFDVTRSQKVAELNFGDAKSVHYDERKEMICARNSEAVLTATAELANPHIFNESCKIKSCCWCGSCVLYTTRSHLKYLVGSTGGVVCSLPRVLYIIRASNSTAWFITRDGVVFTREIEMSEVKLKTALVQSKSDDAARRIIAENRPIGFAIMEFAAKNGRYEIAASLAKDPKKRFEMTILAGDFTAAEAAAAEINEKGVWEDLAKNAMNVGKFAMAENAFRKAGDWENLAMLYLLSGQSDKLQKLSKQTNSLLHYLWANDNESLAKMFATLTPDMELDLSEANTLNVEYGMSCLTNWPVTRSDYIHTTIPTITGGEEDIGEWPSSEAEEEKHEGEEEEGWDINIDIDIPTGARGKDTFIAPAPGDDEHDIWSRNCQTAGDLAAAGRFADALVTLTQSIAVKNTAPLRELFVEAYIAANACLDGMYGNTITLPLSSTFRGMSVPRIPTGIDVFDELTKAAFGSFSRGKFSDCKSVCTSILRKVLIASVATREEEQKIAEIIEVARNYCLAVALETKRKSETDPARALELAVYLTHVQLAPSHLKLVLQSAMRVALKSNDLLTARSVITRLLQLSPNEKIAKQCQMAMAKIQNNPTNTHTIEYDERNPFNVCAMSMKPIYRGKSSYTCPLCGAHYFPQFKGQLCAICEISEIGAQCSGLKVLRSAK